MRVTGCRSAPCSPPSPDSEGRNGGARDEGPRAHAPLRHDRCSLRAACAGRRARRCQSADRGAPGRAARARAVPRADRRHRRAAHGGRGARVPAAQAPAGRRRGRPHAARAGAARQPALRVAHASPRRLRLGRLGAPVPAHAARRLQRRARRLPREGDERRTAPLPASDAPERGRRRRPAHAHRDRPPRQGPGAHAAADAGRRDDVDLRGEIRRLTDEDRAHARDDDREDRAGEPHRRLPADPDRPEAQAPARDADGPRVAVRQRARDPGHVVRPARRRPASRARARVDGVRLPDEDRLARGRGRRAADAADDARVRRDGARGTQDPAHRERRRRGRRPLPEAPAERVRRRREPRAGGLVPGRAGGAEARHLQGLEAVRRERPRAARARCSRPTMGP